MIGPFLLTRGKSSQNFFMEVRNKGSKEKVTMVVALVISFIRVVGFGFKGLLDRMNCFAFLILRG